MGTKSETSLKKEEAAQDDKGKQSSGSELLVTCSPSKKASLERESLPQDQDPQLPEKDEVSDNAGLELSEDAKQEELIEDKPRKTVRLPKLNLAPIIEKQAMDLEKQKTSYDQTAILAPYQPRPFEINYDEDLEIFKIVFEVFDLDKTGYISRDDVLVITVSMKKDFQLVKETLNTIQVLKQQEYHSQYPDQPYELELVSFGEFATLMWQVEQKQMEA